MTPASVLALHGFTAGPEQWRRLVPEATCAHLVGHGPEPHFEVESFEAEVARWAVLAEKLPAPRQLLGYSMGARVGLGLLVARPDLFERAVLVGCNPGLRDPSERAERVAWERSWMRLLQDHGIDAFVDAWQQLPLWASQRNVQAEELARQGRERRSQTAGGLVHALSVLGLGVMPSLWEQLAGVRAHVRLVVGEHDDKFRTLAQAQLEHLPDAQLEIIGAAGHNPLLEAPHALRVLL